MRKALVVWICLILSFLLPVMSQAEPVILRIYGKGAAGDWDHPAFEASHPDVVVEGEERLGVENPADLATVLTTREAYDIYAVAYDMADFRAIMKKGFAYNLAEDEVIADHFYKMYPFLQEALSEGGKVYGVPISLESFHWGCDLSVWERVFFQGRPLPRTYDELLDLIQWWMDEGQALHPDVLLAKGTEDIQRSILDQVMADILFTYPRDVLPVSSVQALLERMVSMDFHQLQPLVMEEGEEGSFLLDTMWNWMQLETYADDPVCTPLPLAIEAGYSAKVSAQMRIFFINPSSHHIQEALAYIATFLQNQGEVYRILTQPGSYDSVENIYVRSAVEERNAAILDWKEKASKKIVDERSASDTISILEGEILSLERGKYLVSQETIAAYQSLTNHLLVQGYSPLLGNGRQEEILHQMVDALQSGQLSADAFLEKLTDLIEKIALENASST